MADERLNRSGKRVGRGVGRGGPARGAGNRSPAAPPFVAGNVVSLHHGAFSPAKLDPLVRDLVLAVLSDPSLDYLGEPRFAAELAAWARAEAAVLLLTAYLDEHGGAIDEAGDERAAARVLDRAENRAANGRKALGLSPLAAARLGRDVAVTAAAQASALDRLRADGARIVEARGVTGGGGAM